MKLVTGTLGTIFSLFILFGCAYVYRQSNPDIQSVDVEQVPPVLTTYGWLQMDLPDGFVPVSVAFGRDGEIVLIGNSILVSNDGGGSWRTIVSGSGFNRCTKDGGKTFDRTCGTYNHRPSLIKVDGDINYLGNVRSPVLAANGRLYLYSFYEHHGELWSVPIKFPKQLWYGLHFTYDDMPDDIKFCATGDLLVLNEKVFASAWAFGDESFRWLGTDDMGNSWHRSYLDNTDQTLMADKRTWLRSSGREIAITENGGVTWRIVQSSKIPENTLSDSFVDDKIGFASGAKGLLAKTNDGGDSWQNVDLGTHEDFYLTQALDGDHVWVGGGDGHLFESDDGGENWDTIDLDTGRDYYSGYWGGEITIDVSRRNVWLIKSGKVFCKHVP